MVKLAVAQHGGILAAPQHGAGGVHHDERPSGQGGCRMDVRAPQHRLRHHGRVAQQVLAIIAAFDLDVRPITRVQDDQVRRVVGVLQLGYRVTDGVQATQCGRRWRVTAKMAPSCAICVRALMHQMLPI